MTRLSPLLLCASVAGCVAPAPVVVPLPPAASHDPAAPQPAAPESAAAAPPPAPPPRPATPRKCEPTPKLAASFADHGIIRLPLEVWQRALDPVLVATCQCADKTL